MTSLHLRLDPGDGDAETAARLTDLLYRDLRLLDDVAVFRVEVEAPPNSKSPWATVLNELVVNGTIPATAAILYRTVKAFLDRAQARSIDLTVGDKKVTITAASGKDVEEALKRLVGDAQE
jgi:hypothetical protein